ncbi:MAG: ABC transporter permease subunit [bacterium]
MFRILVEKELKSILFGPKFIVTFSVCSVLILLSVFVGIQNYRATVDQYEAGISLTDQEMQERTSYRSLGTRVFREPDPMQIFVSGIQNDIGRFSLIRSDEPVKLEHSIYSDDPIFAVFRFIDLTFIVQIVLSLFAILFTYDAINGEREMGTLKLTFANPIPKIQYIVAKFIGSWVGLVIPLTIPILMSFLLVIVFRIPLTGDHWTKLTAYVTVSFLYFTFFIVLGLMVSAMTKRSAVSFLLLLIVWVSFVLIIPRFSVMAAGKIMPVPSSAEIDGRVDAYSKERWEKYIKDLEDTWQERNREMEGMSREEREAYRDTHLWEWMEQEDATRKDMQAEIQNMSRKLMEDLQNRKAEQERLAFTLSRFSPASSYQLAAMDLAGTDIGVKMRYQQAMEDYHDNFVAYTDKKHKESGGGSDGIRITVDSETGFSFDLGKDVRLDLSDMPRFQQPVQTFFETLSQTSIDLGLLILYSVIALAGTFVAFLKYDVR